jgi:hypothetical protein
MSKRGEKGAKAASLVGSSDGKDASYRQHIMNRYELMASYRKELASRLFPLVPCAFAAGLLLTVMHFHVAGLKPLAQAFLPPFVVMLLFHLLAAAVTVRSIYVQSSRPLLVLSSLVAVLLLALASLYASAVWTTDKSKSAEVAARIWWVAGGAVAAFNALLQARAVYCGYLILKLQEDKTAKR